MLSYIIKRLLLIIPTLLGILLINFIIVQAAPGGPVEQVISQIKGHNIDSTSRIAGTDKGDVASQNNSIQTNQAADTSSKYRGSQGLDPEFIAELEKYYGFDKPAHERFYIMLKNYLKFDFGESYFKGQHLKRLVRHQLESYNQFVTSQLKKTIEMFNPVTIHSENDKDENTYVGTLVTATFLLVPPPPSSTIIKSASARSAPISVKPSISNVVAVAPPSLVFRVNRRCPATDKGIDYLPQIIPRTLTLVDVALITDIFVPIHTSLSKYPSSAGTYIELVDASPSNSI